MPSVRARTFIDSGMSAGWSMPSARICCQASARNASSPGSWTARIGPSPWSVGVADLESAVRLEGRADQLGPFEDLVGRDLLAHVRLAHDVVAEVHGRIDDAQASLRGGSVASREGGRATNGTERAGSVDGEDGRRHGRRPVAHEVVPVRAQVHEPDRVDGPPG